MTTKRKRQLGADVLIFSASKSGRTWLRVLLNKYISIKHGIPFTFEDMRHSGKDVPGIVFDHELWRNLSDTNIWQRLTGKHLIPDKVVLGKKLIVLYRDPRDVVVSSFFQMTKRETHRRPESIVNAEMSEFVHNPHVGIRAVVKTLNGWRRRFSAHPRSLWTCYETMRADTLGEFTRILGFIEGAGNVDMDAAAEAVRFSDFENMKKMERNGEFNTTMLTARNAEDPNSFKVREGKVRGYVKHFGPEDLSYLDAELAKLDPFYGYSQ